MNAMRVPSSTRPRPQPSNSGYSFSSNRQSLTTVPTSFNFTQNKHNSRADAENQFLSGQKMPKSRQHIPELVPIRNTSAQNGVKPNGFGGHSQSQNRRSVLDFTNKNRVS